jgi:hypothetical protein
MVASKSASFNCITLSLAIFYLLESEFIIDNQQVEFTIKVCLEVCSVYLLAWRLTSKNWQDLVLPASSDLF